MNFSMMHPADQIVMIMNRIYRYGLTTTSGGNLSIMDDNGIMWISPSGIDKGNLRREDIMRVFPDGTYEGIHTPSVEYPFHQAIYKARPDLKAILHAHPPTLVAFSVARKFPNTLLVPHARLICGELAYAEYALPGSKKLGENISAQFAKGYNTVMLENHGVVIGSPENLFKAFMVFETLDFCARLEINARTIGLNPRPLTKAELERFQLKTHPVMEEYEPVYSSEELGMRRDMCRLIKRAYENELFTSSQGTFSCRVSDDTFLITPYDMDRTYLEPEDLVQIKAGKREKGKIPSRSMHLHEEIYRQHPEINAVIVAHPHNIMAFAVTDQEFDARLIPESYIQLRNVKKYPFGSTFMEAEEMAARLTVDNPVAIIENDCVITTGKSLINAFDRLEVMEYSAKSVIMTHTLGDIVHITDEEVDEIEVAFGLK
ncbi:MAG: class II aldolase/adducin family protein [Firmicutes bacterium]|nr:class II aldolase/adducin family protein [Bacillota bacterium]